MRRNSRAFTVVELLVVMAALATIMAVAAPLILGARERTRTAGCDHAFHALDAEIVNEIDLLTRSESGHPSCGDMDSGFADLQIIRCLSETYSDETNPRNAELRLYFNYIEEPIPYASCQIGFDEDVHSTSLAIKIRQFVSPGESERSFVITID